MARRTIVTKDNTITSQGTEPLSREVARPIFGENVLAIDYNFADKKILDDDIDFSRASSATQTNSEGKICYAPENGLKKSSQLDNWLKLGTNNTTVTAATDITDPLGGNGAFRVTTNQANAGGIYLDSNNQVTKINNKTVQSIYIRSVSGIKTTHVITHNSSSKGLVTITEEWKRIVIPYDSTITAAANFYGVDFRDSDTNATDVYLFAPQISSSLTGEAVEYVPTTTDFVYKERFDYDKDGNSKGLLVSEGRTNLFTYSQDLSQWSWIANDGHILTNADISPDGLKNATKIIPNATGGEKLFKPPSVPTATQGNTYCMSVYVKKAGHRYFKFYFNDTASRLLHVDLDTGQGTLINANGGHSVEEVGNDWYRVWFSHTIVGSNGVGSIFWNSSNSSGFPVTFTGDGSSGVLVWGAQFEQGSFPTSLIPTYGFSASRSADLAKVDGTNFSRFFKDTEGTTVVDLQLPRGLVPNYSRVYNFSNLSTSDEIEIWLHGGNYKVYGQIKKDSVNQGANPASDVLITSGEIAKLGQSYKTNSHSIIQDGFTGFNDTTVNLPTNISQLNLGGRHNNQSQLNGWIRRLRYFNKQKSDTKIKKLTDTSFLLDKFKGAKAAHSLRSLRDGRDNSPVTRIRREYDSFEADYTANQVANGDLEKDFRSADQTTLPLDVSCEATELVVNGAFDSNTTGWTAGGGATLAVDNGRLKITNNATGNSYANQTLTTKVGSQYTVSLDYIDNTGGNALVWVGTSFGGNQLGTNTFTTSGHYTLTFTATATTSYLRIGANEPTNGTIYFFDNVSVKEVNPIATGFSTRKINSSYTGKAMRCRNQGNVEVEVGFDDNNEISLSSPVTNTSQNLLGFSEDFTQWTAENSTVATDSITDPNGGQNAYKLRATSSSQRQAIKLSVSKTGDLSASVFAKKGEYDVLQITDARNGSFFVNFDLTNGTVGSSSGVLGKIESVGDDWFRCSSTFTSSQDILSVRLSIATASDSARLVNFAGNGSDGLYIFGAQLEETVYEDTPSGSELVTNGDFESDSDWNFTTGGQTVEITNGGLRIASDGTFASAQQTVQIVAGKRYSITGDISVTSGSGSIVIDSNQFNYTSSQSFSETFIASLSGGAALQLKRTSGGSASDFIFDNISVKEVAMLSPSEYAQTPVISDDGSNTTATTLGEFSGLENIFPYSVRTSGVSASLQWTPSMSGTDISFSATSPTGSQDAYEFRENGSTLMHGLFHYVAGGYKPNQTYVFSSFVKSVGGRNIALRAYSRNSSNQIIDEVEASFNLSNGTVFSNHTSSGVEAIITNEGSDWYRISMKFTTSGNVDTSGLYSMVADIKTTPEDGSTGSKAGDTSKGFVQWGTQLNTNSLKPVQKTSGTPFTGDVHVVNWYDQNHGEDFIQDTATRQPRIVMGSELVTDSGGKASVYFDGSDNLINESLAGQNRLDSYIAIEPDLDANDSQVLFSNNDGGLYGMIFDDGSSSQTLSFGYGSPNEFVNGTQLDSNATRNDLHDRLNNTSVFSLIGASSSLFSTFQMGWFNSAGSSLNYQGNLSEMVFFPNMDSSQKRFNIEQNMLRHFDVNLVTNGTFDSTDNWTVQSHWSVSGGVVNYNDTGNSALYQSVSFKKGSSYRLRFEISNASTTARLWIGNLAGTYAYVGGGYQSLSNGSYDYTFTVSQDESVLKFFGHTDGGTFSLDNVVLEQVGTSGYVTTLYDQTGNNCHAVQTTAANQPQLVSGGDLIKSGNHPAWEFTSGNPQRNLALQGMENLTTLDAFFVHETGSNQQFIYPSSNNSSYFGFIAHNGNATTSTTVNYGSPILEVNGVEKSPSDRDDVYDEIAGRKLVYHRSASTTTWTGFNVGFFDNTSNNVWNLEDVKFSEMVFWDSDQHSNQSGIESNINTHYNIY